MVKKIEARESKTKGKVMTRKVLFEFLSPEAKEVYLAGEFNRWDTHANTMERDKDGIWRTTLSLKPGRYEYRLLVDGNWENAPSCSGCVPNIFGSQNCVKIVE
jgi:1,4-alpha-glucan branching enzyme